MFPTFVAGQDNVVFGPTGEDTFFLFVHLVLAVLTLVIVWCRTV